MGSGSRPTTLFLHQEAPPKPRPGDPCNGCGICCASRPCPVSLILFRSWQAPCPALQWNSTQKRYRCTLLTQPTQHLRWLPRQLEPLAIKLFHHRIAAGRGCDCTIEIETVKA